MLYWQVYVVLLSLQLKSLGTMLGLKPSPISVDSLHSTVKLVPPVTLTFVILGVGGGAEEKWYTIHEAHCSILKTADWENFAVK